MYEWCIFQIHKNSFIDIVIFILFIVAISHAVNGNSRVDGQESQLLNQENLYQIANPPSKLDDASHLPVGDRPSFLEHTGDKLYIANSLSNTISVINSINYTKMGEDIPVGEGPDYMLAYGDKLYIANSLSNTKSVINLINN